MASLGRQFSGPQYQQQQFPGLQSPPEQMRMFDTHRAGPANLYTLNRSGDANDWGDQDKQVPLNQEEQEAVDDDEYTVQGDFFEFPIGREDREFGANKEAFGRSQKEFSEGGSLLGYDAYPERVRPDLQFSDLTHDAEYDRSQWWTEDTEVGRVQFHEDEWGTNVDYAEINPLYQGRGFSRDAMRDFTELRAEDTPGIVHAGSYTHAGAGAFHSKGVPTVDEIDYAYDEFRGNQEIDADTLREALEMNYPEEDWDSPDAPQGIVESLREDLEFDLMEDREEGKMEFRDSLEEKQSQVLSMLPGRKGAFKQGWKAKYPTFGTPEKLPGT